MTDISFSIPARLLTSEGPLGPPPAHGAGTVDQGSLGRLVGRVMGLTPDERRRYSIFADGGAYLHAHEIEALASTRKYADWNAGQS